MTIDEKYENNQMSAFERKIYETKQKEILELIERKTNLSVNSARIIWDYASRFIKAEKEILSLKQWNENLEELVLDLKGRL